MKSVVRPELPTAAAGSSQAPTAAVDNSAPRSTHPEPTYKSGKAVQITGTTSVPGRKPHTRIIEPPQIHVRPYYQKRLTVTLGCSGKSG